MDLERLKKLLDEHGVSRTQLAQWLGRDKAVVTNLFKGTRALKAEEAMRIAQRLGVPLGAVLGEGEAEDTLPGLEEPSWIPFQHEPVQAKNASQVVRRGGKYFLEESAAFGPRAYALEVRDDSLNLLGILPGDVVISALDAKAEPGKIVVVQRYEGAGASTVLRRYDPPFLTPHSTNPAWRPLSLEKDDVRVVSPVLKLVRLW